MDGRPLKKLGHRVARSTIANTLKENGIPPSTGRTSSWRTFPRSRAEVIAGAEFFTAEVWTARGPVTHYVLIDVHHATRAAHIAGTTPNPDADFMAQGARNLTGMVDGFPRDRRYLIVDRDSRLAELLEHAGTKVVRISRGSPDTNAIAERRVLPRKSDCLNRLALFGEGSLRRALRAYGVRFHHDGPHRGLDNELIEPRPPERVTATGELVEAERPGGLLRSFRRVAA